MTSIIRRLCPDDAPALLSLRREALEHEPLAFASSVEDDRLTLDFARTILAADQEQAVFGLFLGADLAGMVGVMRDSKVKRRHRGTIWGMYVAPRARRQGMGRALLEMAIAHARRWPGLEQLELSVSDTAVNARRMYETAGFRSWGREPRSLHWNRRFVDDHHLVLELHDRSPA
jgi:ribosomal protein S18 acetylase RimI-like enzyme